MDSILKRLRKEDRAEAAAALGEDFRHEVLASLSGRKPERLRLWDSLLIAWDGLLSEPRWALATLTLAAGVTIGTTWLTQREALDDRSREALSLEVFAPFPDHAPETLLFTKASYRHD